MFIGLPGTRSWKAGDARVCQVNARQAKNLPGRKTDVKDCQWLQQLHSYWLLTRSFRPQSEIIGVKLQGASRKGPNRSLATRRIESPATHT